MRQFIKKNIWNILSTIIGIASIYYAEKSINAGKQDVPSIQEQMAKDMARLVTIAGNMESSYQSMDSLLSYYIALEQKKSRIEQLGKVYEHKYEPEFKVESPLSVSNSIVQDTISLAEPKVPEIAKGADQVVLGIGAAGWIYIGNFSSRKKEWKSNYNKTIIGFESRNIQIGDTLTIKSDVGFNQNKPAFPSYEDGLIRKFPYVLNPNTIVEVQKVEEVGIRSFTWAKVKILN